MSAQNAISEAKNTSLSCLWRATNRHTPRKRCVAVCGVLVVALCCGPLRMAPPLAANGVRPVPAFLFRQLPLPFSSFLLTLIPSHPPTRSATSTTEIEARKSELRLAAEQLVNLSRVVTSLLAASTFMCKSSLGLYTQNLSLACRLAKEDVEPSRRRRCRHTRRQTVNNFFETYNRGVRRAAKARRFTGFGK